MFAASAGVTRGQALADYTLRRPDAHQHQLRTVILGPVEIDGGSASLRFVASTMIVIPFQQAYHQHVNRRKESGVLLRCVLGIGEQRLPQGTRCPESRPGRGA